MYFLCLDPLRVDNQSSTACVSCMHPSPIGTFLPEQAPGTGMYTPSSLACCCAGSWLSRLAEPKATSLASLKLRFVVPCKSGLVSCFIFQLVPCPPPCLVQCSPHKYLGCDFSHICPQPYHALISWHFGFSFVHVPSLVPLTVPGTQ